MRQAVADCDDENWEFVVVDWEVRACVGPGLEPREARQQRGQLVFVFSPYCRAVHNETIDEIRDWR